MTSTRVTLASVFLASILQLLQSQTSGSTEMAPFQRLVNSSSNFEPRRQGYHHPDTNADGQKENQFSPSSGFMPIAKPLIQDIYDKHYDISSSERNANHLHHHQQDPDNSSTAIHDNGPADDQYHRYFSQTPQTSFDGAKGEEAFKDYSYTQAHPADHYFDENRARPESSNRHYFKMPMNSPVDAEMGKFMAENNRPTFHQPPNSGSSSSIDDASVPNLHHSEPEPYGKNQHGFMSEKQHRPPYSVYNDEQSMMHPDSAVHLLKNIAQPEYAQSHVNEQSQLSQSPSEHEIQSLLNQFTSQNMAMKPSHEQQHQLQQQHSMQQDYSTPNMNEFAPFAENPMASPSSMSDINGIAGFQPAPEGGQLPAPPGYKHVGYITIPAGAANLPNMVSQPNNGLPLIRPIPINSATELGKLNKNKQDAKKNQDNKASESKPMRSFLSRLNPLNMLRRLRQRRERRQTSDISSSDYLPISGNRYGTNYGGGYPSSYQMAPYGAGYGSISGLGGMSGLGAMYSSMASPSQMYSPSYGSYAYSGYPSGYPTGYGSYMSHAASPYDMKSASNSAPGDMSAAASAVSPQAATAASHGMPMGMPMSGYAMGYPGMGGMPMSGYGMGFPGMGGMPMGSMPMPFGYPGHSAMQGGQSSASSSGSSSSDPSNPLAGQTLPGGINLSDLLKDEEDEPSRFRKFLGYLNPMNIVRRFRNNTSEERKRFGRYKRDLQLYLVNVKPQSHQQMEERSDDGTEPRSAKDHHVVSSPLEQSNSTSEHAKSESDSIDEMDDMIFAHDTAPKAIHGRRKGIKRAKYNLMGSRNFEIIRGGAFQTDDMTPLRSSEVPHEYDQTATNTNGGGGNVLSEVDEEVFDNEAPEIMGFQGFNGFSSLYNSLSASNQSPNFVEPSKANAEPNAVHDQKAFQSIEHAAITSSELKAIS